MPDQIAKLAPEILDVIQKASKILLHFHPSPDADSVGSSLAMRLALEEMGKQVTVIAGDSELTKVMSFLPRFDQVTPKNYLEINPGAYDLFLILDSSSSEMISKQGEVKFPDNLNTIVIDHHASNRGFGKINLIEPDYPATAQVVFDLLQTWQVNITSEIARCLMLGLYTDTGGFQYLPRDPAYSFEVARQLAEVYPGFPQDIFALDNSNTPGKLRFEGLALSQVKLYFNSRVAISEIRLKDWQEKNIKIEDTQKSDIANKLKSVLGWEIGIIFIESERDVINVGLRTRDSQKYDLSKLAAALGGGGHKAAAGALIKKPFEQAKQLVLQTIKQTYSLE